MNNPIILSVVVLVISLSLVNCGLVDAQKRIINGEDSVAYTYRALVTAVGFEFNQIGGGTFISYRHLVTSASLIHRMDWWFIEYGSLQLTALNYARVERAIAYSQYDPVSFQHDIGVLFLEKDALYSEYQFNKLCTWSGILLFLFYFADIVNPIPLSYVINPPFFYEQGLVSSFGMTLTGNEWVMQEKMQTGYFDRIERHRCDFVLGHELPETSFCAQDITYGASLCYGDHGSGFTTYVNGVNSLVGVVSIFTNMCNRDFPVVFTEVARYASWISQQIA